MRADPAIADIHRRFAALPASFGAGRPAPRAAGLYSTRPRGCRPIVAADANSLISDATRGARGKTTLMSGLAKQGAIRIVTAEHIDEKVYAHLPNACRRHGDLDAATDYYEREYRPLMRFVDAGELAISDPRVARVRLADAEDVALAQIGVALAPSLIFTWDPHLIEAGLGAKWYGDQLVLLRALVSLDDEMWGMAEGAVTTGKLATMGVQGFVGMLRRSDLLLAATIALAGLIAFQYRHRLHELPTAIKTKAGPAAADVFEQLDVVFGSWQDAQNDVEPHLIMPSSTPTIESEVALILAQRTTPTPAADIHAAIRYDRREAMSVKDLLQVLWATAAFEFRPGQGWMLGHHLG